MGSKPAVALHNAHTQLALRLAAWAVDCATQSRCCTHPWHAVPAAPTSRAAISTPAPAALLHSAARLIMRGNIAGRGGFLRMPAHIPPRARTWQQQQPQTPRLVCKLTFNPSPCSRDSAAKGSILVGPDSQQLPHCGTVARCHDAGQRFSPKHWCLRW